MFCLASWKFSDFPIWLYLIMSLFVCIFSSAKIITSQTVFRKGLSLYIKYIVPMMVLSQHYSVLLCVLASFKNVFSYFEFTKHCWLVKYKRYCKHFFEEMKSLTQQWCSKAEITWRLNLFSLSSTIIEWSVLCSWMSLNATADFLSLTYLQFS